MLIAPRWGLTAQHCIVREKAADLLVILNSIDLLDLSNLSEFRQVRDIYMYNNSPPSRGDLALLHLDNSAQKIIPIPLSDQASKTGDKLITMGYGSTDETTRAIPSTLQYAEVKVETELECEKDEFYLSKEICTIGIDGGYVLYGDSGGPLIRRIGRSYFFVRIVNRLGSDGRSYYASLAFPDHYRWVTEKISHS